MTKTAETAALRTFWKDWQADTPAEYRNFGSYVPPAGSRFAEASYDLPDGHVVCGRGWFRFKGGRLVEVGLLGDNDVRFIRDGDFVETTIR